MEVAAVQALGIGRNGDFRVTAGSWIKSVLALTVAFNLIDALLTIFVVDSGFAVEANPLMKILLEWGPGWFLAAKLGMVSAGVRVLWRYRDRVLAGVGSLFVFAVYAGLMFHHMESVRLAFSFALA